MKQTPLSIWQERQSREIRSQPVKPSDVQIAEEQLAISRAASQLAIALALQKERLLLCELNVLDAERELLQTTNFHAFQERLAAKVNRHTTDSRRIHGCETQQGEPQTNRCIPEPLISGPVLKMDRLHDR